MLVTSSPTTAALPSQKGLPRLVQMSYPMEPWSVDRHCYQISHASWSILMMAWLMFIIGKEKDMLMSSLLKVYLLEEEVWWCGWGCPRVIVPFCISLKKFDWSALSQQDCPTSCNYTTAIGLDQELGSRMITHDLIMPGWLLTSFSSKIFSTWIGLHICLTCHPLSMHGMTRVVSLITSHPCHQSSATGSAISSGMESNLSTLFTMPD